MDGLFARLQQHATDLAPSTDQIGRPWHDGLAVVHPSAGDSFDIYRSARRLLLRLDRHLIDGDEKPSIKMSLGIALYPDDGNTPAALLDHAYSAAKRAERWGENGFCFFSRSAGREVADRLSMDIALMRAFKAGTVDMRFQPVVDLRQPRMIGVIGEPDWRHPEQGDQPAKVIMDSVERMDMARVYNAWLIDRLCRQSDQGSRRLRQRRIGFQVMRSQLAGAALATDLASALEARHLPASLIEVAIDGNLLFDHTDHRLRTGLQQLADLGVQLTVVNIGVEPLPLEALGTLPLSAVEFAPEMVSTIGRCSTTERTLAALSCFMSKLGLRSRAAGVTTEAQLGFLREIHCDEATGSLLTGSM